MFNLGITTKIFNGEMRQAREKLGYTQTMLAKVVDVQTTTIGQLERMEAYPKFEKLEDIADCLGSDVETMFPEWLRTQQLKKSKVTQYVPVNRIELNNPALHHLSSGVKPEEETEKVLRNDNINKAMDILSDREKKIISMRYGLNNSKKHTLQEIANEFQVTKERIRQFEMKILTKLRHSPVLKKIDREDY